MAQREEQPLSKVPTYIRRYPQLHEKWTSSPVGHRAEARGREVSILLYNPRFVKGDQ